MFDSIIVEAIGLERLIDLQGEFVVREGHQLRRTYLVTFVSFFEANNCTWRSQECKLSSGNRTICLIVTEDQDLIVHVLLIILCGCYTGSVHTWAWTCLSRVLTAA
jgi:hypothetical protein